MKTYKTLMLAIAGAALLSACSDDDKWQPGDAVDLKAQVYLVTSSLECELEPGQTATFDVVFGRDDATDAISVPVYISDTENFTMPSTVDFAAGEKESTVQLMFNGVSNPGYYDLSIQIPEGEYNSPYTSHQVQLDFSLLVAKWDKICDLEVNASQNKSIFTKRLVDLYMLDQEGADDEKVYRIRGLFEDTDITFHCYDIIYSDDKPYYGYIEFKGGYYLSSDPMEWGYRAWAFFDQDTLYDDDTTPWLTVPGVDLYFYNPFIMADTSYSWPCMYYGDNIYFMLCFYCYDTDWNYNSSVSWERFTLNMVNLAE